MPNKRPQNTKALRKRLQELAHSAGVRVFGVADLEAALRQLGLADGFAPRAGREVFTERDFCDEHGRVHRMDRLVVDPDHVLVVDWKTGDEKIGTPEQEAQVRAYAGILRQVYPGRTVDALLVHLDRLETRSVV